MNIAICSAFRDAAGYVQRYASQMQELYYLLKSEEHQILLIIACGDNQDNTEELLQEAILQIFPAILLKANHGGRKWTSVVSRDRFQQLAFIANLMWESIPTNADISVLLDPDLIWEARTIARLVERLQEVPAVAPKILHRENPNLYKGEGPFWYDTFAFRCNGARFTNEPPWYPALEYKARNNNGLVQLDSVGGCFAVRSEVARSLRFPEEDVVVGFCRQVYNNGASIWLDYDLTVYHP